MTTKAVHFFESIGRKANPFFVEVARMSHLAKESFYWGFIAPITGKKGLRRSFFFQQLVFAGNESLPIAFLVAASVGAVLALQAAYQLKQFGALMYTGALVALSMTRELGPILTSIVVAGRVGASMTAELGTMKTQEEIDALTTMGIPPIPYLVVPRILAIAIMLPCLAILNNIIGMLGGLLVGWLGLGIDPNIYMTESLHALVAKDILTGIAKSFVFALLIGLICTYKGLSTHGGAESVGRSTTQAVVLSTISVIVSDCLLTAIFYYVFP